MIQLWPANEQADKYPQALLHPFTTKEQFQIKEIDTTLQDTFFSHVELLKCMDLNPVI